VCQKFTWAFHGAKLQKKFMLMRNEQNQRIVLAHWTYNREEWKNFIRWDKMRRGALWYVVYYFSGKKETTIPQITITNKKIWIGNSVESFNDINKQIKRINIRDQGRRIKTNWILAHG